LAGQQADRLAGLTPPRDAAAFHEDYIDALRDVERLASRAANASEAGDPAIQTTAVTDLQDVITAWADSAAESQLLAGATLVLKTRDPLAAYLVAASELRAEFSPAISEIMSQGQRASAQNASEQQLGALSDTLIDTLESFRLGWQDLPAPEQAKAVHDQQIALSTDTIEFHRTFNAAIEARDAEAVVQALQLSHEVRIKGVLLTADWNDLLIQALSQ
jgi:hypothetical protein